MSKGPKKGSRQARPIQASTAVGPAAGPTQQHSGVLTGREIRDRALVRGANWNQCLKAASYDLRLGDEVIRTQDDKLHVTRLDQDGGVSLSIEPMESVIFSTLEQVVLPDGIVGRFDLKMVHVLGGLIFQVGPQIKPGYEGPLFGLITNTSGRTRMIGSHAPFATIEFSYTTASTAPLFKPQVVRDLRGFVEAHGEFVSTLVAPSVLDDLRAEIKSVKKLLHDCGVAHGVKTNEAALIETKRGNGISAKNLAVAKIGIPIALVAALAAIVGILSTPGCDLSELPAKIGLAGSSALQPTTSSDLGTGPSGVASSSPSSANVEPKSLEASDGAQR